MGQDKFQQSLSEGAHRQLGQLSGEWNGLTSVWFEQSKPEDESAITASFTPILGGRFMLYEYKTAFKDDPVEGMAIIGYSIGIEAYQCAWVDSFHMGTGILFSEGAKTEKLFSALGHYSGPGIPEPWGWRTEIEMQDEKVVITAYNISPEGESMKATETILTRIK